MKNKTILITGATNGIGQAIAEGLATKGAGIVIVSRSEARCAATAQQIGKAISNVNISYYAADLSSRSETKDLITRLNQDLSRLDVLINNAGAWFMQRQLSTEGTEMSWALNHLSYFHLAHGLIDLLKKTATEHGEARIINQASGAHHEGTFSWENLQFDGTWDSEGKGSVGAGWGAYSQSKLANVTHAFALARRLEGTGVVANAIHPGVVVTGFSQNNGLLYKVAAPVRRLFNRASPDQGAAPAIYLASAPEASSITGAYYGPPNRREEANPLANDVGNQDRLWEISMTQIGIEKPVQV
ncbi:MAG: SDR family NAD(P)-dependent oxidoreductase [Chloroflexota bacterium]